MTITMKSNSLRSFKEQSQYTIVFLGDVKTGKTALVSQCVFGSMKTGYKPTIEDSYRTLARLPDGKYKTVNLIDTAGTMEFPAMREFRIRSATAVVIVYDVKNIDSMNMVSLLKKQVQQIREYESLPIMVIGNTRSQPNNTLNYQIPAGIMDDSMCEHKFMDLSDSSECKKVYNHIIEKCYEASDIWKVEYYGSMTANQKDIDRLQKKRGLLSYLSFRLKSKKRPVLQPRSASSLL